MTRRKFLYNYRDVPIHVKTKEEWDKLYRFFRDEMKFGVPGRQVWEAHKERSYMVVRKKKGSFRVLYGSVNVKPKYDIVPAEEVIAFVESTEQSQEA